MGLLGLVRNVWMSHGDEVVKWPDGFEVVARSNQGAVAAIENRERRFYGLQYHSEVKRAFLMIFLEKELIFAELF